MKRYCIKFQIGIILRPSSGKMQAQQGDIESQLDTERDPSRFTVSPLNKILKVGVG